MAISNAVISTWMKLTASKMVLSALCISILFTGWYIRDEVKSLARLYVDNVVTRTVADYSLPTKVSIHQQAKIQDVFKSFMRENDKVGALLIYEFVPNGNSMLYQGSSIITYVSQSGKDVVKRYNASWIPMNSDREQLKKILDGEIFYRPSHNTKTLSSNNINVPYNLKLMENDGFVYMISVPVFNTTSNVIGYITALLTNAPKNDLEFGLYIIKLENQAVELSQYLI